MTNSTLHVVFDPAVAENLRLALELLGRTDEVVYLPYKLSYGPLEPLEDEARARWIEATFDISDEHGFQTFDSEEFWLKALDPARRRIAWTSRRELQARLGLLAWASRLKGHPVEVIDLTDLKTADLREEGGAAHPHAPLSLLTPKTIVERRLIETAVPFSSADQASAICEWNKVCSEEAPFRKILNGRIEPLPITAYDDLLMDYTVSQWRKAARVIGEAICDLHANQQWGVGDAVLAARLRSLVANFKLESKGDLYNIRYWEVRRPLDLP